ncbi:tripartite tricarboxylate transporter permease [Streptomyces sp. NPDC001027]|uniref:tripartite tricarboxylate transporter permease n=1 Tax=Streptomyces sp. NPDC001027 TaxID=3154771 RepID=UPI00331DDEE7
MDGVLRGLEVATEPTNVLFVGIGVVIGMVIGVLPGLGPGATIAMLLPLTFGLDPSTAVIMLAGIYYGSMYGGTITSVLLNLPGEATSVITAIDGHAMAKQGRAGPALGIAAIGSFVGGIVASVALVVVSGPLASVASRFGPPEYAAVGILGLALVTVLASGSTAKALVMAGVGLLLATIGQDPISAEPRFTFGFVDLLGGLDFVPIVMGLFGVGDILHNLRHREPIALGKEKIGRALPTRSDLRQSTGAIGRGTAIGTAVGLVPGAGGTLSSMISYAVEKRWAKDPSRFGKGAIEGVAAPETANNAGATSSFVPLLTIGIPANAAMALMFGALMMQGITPGPDLVDAHPDVFWGVIASMFIGNIMLLALNIPLVAVFIQLLRVPPGILAATTVLVSLIGVYALNSSTTDMIVLVVASLVGYLLRKAGYEPSPLVLAFILGAILDKAFRTSLLMSDGSPTIFVSRPVSATILGLGLVVILAQVVSGVRRKRAQHDATGQAATSHIAEGRHSDV